MLELIFGMNIQKKNPSVYNNKSYHTYAYVESISEILNINGKEQHIKKFKENFVNDEWLSISYVYKHLKYL